MTGDSLKRRLRQGGGQLGIVMMLPSPDVAEIVGQSGIDVAMIDHEHGTGGVQDFVAQARALRSSAMRAMVRVPPGDLRHARRLLDAGCEAIVFPAIDTAEEAAAAVAACRYPPRGERGAGAGIRAAGYGLDPGYYAPEAEDGRLIVIQIESARAVDEIDAICAVEGVDMLLIGPRDLAASMGLLNAMGDPALWEKVDHAARRVKAAGKYLASTLRPGRTVGEMFAEGYDLVLAAKDVDFILDGARGLAASARGAA